MTKKYHVFAGSNYYPDIGLGDYKGSYETHSEAKAKALILTGQNWVYIMTHNEDGSLREEDI